MSIAQHVGLMSRLHDPANVQQTSSWPDRALPLRLKCRRA